MIPVGMGQNQPVNVVMALAQQRFRRQVRDTAVAVAAAVHNINPSPGLHYQTLALSHIQYRKADI